MICILLSKVASISLLFLSELEPFSHFNPQLLSRRRRQFNKTGEKYKKSEMCALMLLIPLQSLQYIHLKFVHSFFQIIIKYLIIQSSKKSFYTSLIISQFSSGSTSNILVVVLLSVMLLHNTFVCDNTGYIIQQYMFELCDE